jgi:pyruvate formate-lyase activating enzyme-like uncharacterized protein
MREIEETKYESWKLGALAEGCKYCVRGEKLVLFITGLCNVKCYYCPISDNKYGKDVVYANEKEIKNVSEAIEEAKLSGSKGCGITGGDPLLKVERCVEYIKALKKEFGNNFHIHLYTTTKNISEDKLKMLYDAGLNEIRFHLKEDFEKIEMALKYNWDVGVEVPVVPGEDLTKMVDFIEGKVKFLNLNELEMADNENCDLSKFETRDELSYAVKGSEEEALKLLNYCKDKKLNVHFCTARLKNVHQLGNRIKLRAKIIAEPFDTITSEGTLVRGFIEGDDFADVLHYLKARGIKFKLEEKRIIFSKKDAEKLAEKIKDLGFKVGISEEYPTSDRMQVEMEYL